MATPAREQAFVTDHFDQRAALQRIINSYDGVIARTYCYARFQIIDINMLHILALCMKGKSRILEIGCGFGLFGCYFASRWPEIKYVGLDINTHRIEMAREAARRLGLSNAHFEHGDASKPLAIEGEYDAVLMMDLLHHLPDTAKRSLLDAASARLGRGGRLIIKEVTRKPAWKMGFTWLLDVVMTRGFDMWYWDPTQVRAAVDPELSLETYPITDWLPYPHIVYLFSKQGPIGERRRADD
jgi:2-polyprenyl-3-methyl-5-hydroxy-6-metoxy-1,4-benzoquinol methylase